MRAAVFAVILGFAGAASAQSLGQVCQRLIGSQVTECMAAPQGRWIDPQAVGRCSNLIGSQVIACVSAIAGKDYSYDEANACGSLIGSQVIDCFRRTGRTHVNRPPPPPPPVYSPPPPPPPQRYDDRDRRGLSDTDIRAEIAAALEALRANDINSAERRLRRLLKDLR